MTPTISTAAAETMAALQARAAENIAKPAPDDLTGWDALYAMQEAAVAPVVQRALAQYRPQVRTERAGPLNVEVITPATLAGEAKVVYLHGGAYTLFSARSSMFASAPLAHDLALEVWSIDYPLAPRSRYGQTVPQVADALSSIIAMGTPVVLVGDSAGGGLALAASLELCAREAPLPVALGLWSPWTDVTNSGESHRWLAKADLFLRTPDLDRCALAYAPADAHRTPSVSPLYGRYTSRFPPTLVQCGTREVLLSDAVRLARVLDAAGVQAQLDVWEGMCHSFPVVLANTPEAHAARVKLRRFCGILL